MPHSLFGQIPAAHLWPGCWCRGSSGISVGWPPGSRRFLHADTESAVKETGSHTIGAPPRGGHASDRAGPVGYSRRGGNVSWRFVQKFPDDFRRHHSRTLGHWKQRNPIAFACYSLGRRFHRSSDESGNHHSQRFPFPSCQHLRRFQHVIIQIKGRSHAKNITHHASRVKFGTKPARSKKERSSKAGEVDVNTAITHGLIVLSLADDINLKWQTGRVSRRIDAPQETLVIDFFKQPFSTLSAARKRTFFSHV
jgi:hypothetical protein